MKLDELVAYLDEFLGTYSMQDSSDNGLQVAGIEEVDRLAFAVDACQQTIDGAIQGGAQMLVVHHGLFWGKSLRLVGPHRRRVQALLDAGCSLYAVHLPLDRHPEIGNNAQLARLLDLTVVDAMGEVSGIPVGVIALPARELARDEIVDRLALVLGSRPAMSVGGPETVHRVGIISGSAAGYIGRAVAAGCDTFITGETSHSAFHDAAEYGINVIYAGHYATETVGLQALADHLAGKFGLSVSFVDRPTGL